MTLSRLDRQLIVSAGVAAAWRGNRESAVAVREALSLLVPDENARQQCEKIFSVLLDKRRLTQPSYCTSEALLDALSGEERTSAVHQITQPV